MANADQINLSFRSRSICCLLTVLVRGWLAGWLAGFWLSSVCVGILRLSYLVVEGQYWQYHM